jgi:hypothetical protein
LQRRKSRDSKRRKRTISEKKSEIAEQLSKNSYKPSISILPNSFFLAQKNFFTE